MKAVRGFKRATVYVCDPDEDRGSEKHDRLHRTFYIYYEVDDEASLQKWIQNEVCSVISSEELVFNLSFTNVYLLLLGAKNHQRS